MSARNERQRRVFAWAWNVFGGPVVRDVGERAERFAEEAIELVQALGLSRERVLAVVDHVYAKPPGTLEQEAGQAGVSLLALCESIGLSADACEAAEFERVSCVPFEAMRQRQRAKAAAGVGLEPRA